MKLQWQHLNQYIKFIYIENVLRPILFVVLLWLPEIWFYWWFSYFSVLDDRQSNNIYLHCWNGRKSDVSFANNFSKDSKLSGRSFIYTKKRKGPSIEPSGTPARTGDQFEDWPLRTTLGNLSLRKLWKSLWKLPEIPASIVIPRAKPYQKLLRYLRS